MSVCKIIDGVVVMIIGVDLDDPQVGGSQEDCDSLLLSVNKKTPTNDLGELLLLIHIISVMSLQLKKLRRHNKSAIDLSNANPACGHKEVRRSTGHIMVTIRYSDQQGSKSRQKLMPLYKQWHHQCQNGSSNLLAPYREQPRSTQNVAAYPRPAFSAKKRKNYAPTSFDQQVQVSRGHTLYRKNKKQNREVHGGGGGLELVKPEREPASSRPKPCASLKKLHESCPFAAPCGPRRKKNDRGQTSAFPSETSRFKSVILAHRGSALPWLFDDRAALRLRRIWCVPTR